MTDHLLVRVPDLKINLHIMLNSDIKYQNDIRWVSQNTTLYYGVRCQKIDNMFWPELLVILLDQELTCLGS